MKTLAENKLAFRKSSVTELNNSQMQDVNGGSTPGTTTAAASTTGCLVVLSIVAIVAITTD